MSFKCFFNSHFVFVSQIHISFLQGSSFRFAVIKKSLKRYTIIKARQEAVTLSYRAFSI